jgi:hypothetical protein
VDFSWTCNATTGVCTASADLSAWAQLILEGVWFLGGAVMAAACMVCVAVVFMRRV